MTGQPNRQQNLVISHSKPRLTAKDVAAMNAVVRSGMTDAKALAEESEQAISRLFPGRGPYVSPTKRLEEGLKLTTEWYKQAVEPSV